jgi:hypothetical protein
VDVLGLEPRASALSGAVGFKPSFEVEQRADCGEIAGAGRIWRLELRGPDFLSQRQEHTGDLTIAASEWPQPQYVRLALWEDDPVTPARVD